MWDRLCTVRLEQFLNTFPQYSQVSFRDLPVTALRASGSKRAASLPLAAMAFKALGSMGGNDTPGGSGGMSMSEMEDRFRPVRLAASLSLGERGDRELEVGAGDPSPGDLAICLNRSLLIPGLIAGWCPPAPGIQRPAKRLL